MMKWINSFLPPFRIRRIAAAGLAMASAFGLFADGTCQIDVASGSRSLTSAELDDLAGHDEIEKIGAGTLVVGGELSGFKGTIRIREGVYEVTASGALGTADGATYVSSGASLRLAGATSGCIAFGNEVVHIAGRGTQDSPGALNNIGRQQLSAFKYVVLDDHATVAIASTSARFDVRDGSLSMSGKTFTVASDHEGQSFSLTRVNLTGGGNIVVEKGILQIEGRNALYTWEGDAGNTLTVKSGAYLQRSDSSWSYIPWTLKLEKGARVRSVSAGRDNDAQDEWAGPVVIEGKQNETAVTGSYTSDSILRFSGPVSGEGIFNWTGGWIYLYNPTNSFTGTWRCSKEANNVGGLVLANTGAVTTVAQAIDMRGGSVLKLNASGPYALPPLNFDGTRDISVTGGCGTAVSMKKSGSGRLDFGGRVVVTGSTEIAGGTVRLTGRVPYGNAGLWHGLHLCAGDETAGNLFHSRVLYKDNVTNSIFYAYTDNSTRGNHGNSTGSCATFSGYCWNRSGTSEVWTVSTYAYIGVKFWLGDAENVQEFGSSGRKFTNVTMAPGANAFEVRFYRGDKWMPSGNEAGDGWASANGFVYAIGGDRTAPAEFRKFEDPGDGSLLTCDLEPRSTLDASLYRARFDNLKLAGGRLDLNDREIAFQAKTLAGYGEVTNGVFRLSGKWIVTADAVSAGGIAFKDADLQFAEGAGFVADDIVPASVPDEGLVVGTVAGGTVTGLSEWESADRKWIVRASVGGDIRLYRKVRGINVSFR